MSRLCPLCDRAVDGLECAVHQVPTVDPTRLAAPVELSPGALIAGRWTVEGALGAGGMARTLRVRDRQGTEAVLKLPHLTGRRLELVRRLYQEARAIGRLEHPVIVRLLGFGVDEDSGLPYLLMEKARGVSLGHWLKSQGAMGEQDALAVVRALGEALDHAHARGVLHRDLTPGNVMLERAGDGLAVRLLDFGLARVALDSETPPLTEPGKCVGTPTFMSPEQITGGAVDERSDLYGLGCLLHALLAGGPPYAGSQALAVMQAHLRNPIPALPAQLRDGRAPSAGLARLHRALLAKSRLERPGSAARALALLSDPAPEPGAQPAQRRTIPPAPTLPAGTGKGGAIPPAETQPAAPREEGRTLVAPRPLDEGDAPQATPALAATLPGQGASVALETPERRWVPVLIGSVAALGLLSLAATLLIGAPPRASSPPVPRDTVPQAREDPIPAAQPAVRAVERPSVAPPAEATLRPGARPPRRPDGGVGRLDASAAADAEPNIPVF